jgi:hypothetical protein
MTKFKTTLLQFAEQGEKTGWTYIEVPAKVALQLKPGNKKTFRVKGMLDDFAIKAVAIMPRGDGSFILPVNATMRKGIKKRKGATLQVQLEVDNNELKPPKALLDCLADDPEALAFFNSLAKGHQNYFGNWIKSAKTEPTKTKRIAQAVTALARKQDFGTMIRALKKDREDLMG